MRGLSFLLTKVCTKCQRELEANEENFRKGKGYKYGLRSNCRNCESEVRKEKLEQNRERWQKWAENNIEHLKQYNHERYLSKKEEYNAKRALYYQENKEAELEKNRQWVKSNPEKVKEIGRMNKRRRDSRKKELKSDLTISEWKETLILFDNKCAYCQKEFEVLEQEHFIPVTKGGEHTKRNIIPACRQCNASKSNKTFENWYRKQTFFDELRFAEIIEFIEKG